jgi:hypothetical protein
MPAAADVTPVRPSLRALLPICVLIAGAVASPTLASEALTDHNATLQSIAVNGRAKRCHHKSQTATFGASSPGSCQRQRPASIRLSPGAFKFDYAGGCKYRNAKYWTLSGTVARPRRPDAGVRRRRLQGTDGSYWQCSHGSGAPLLLRRLAAADRLRAPPVALDRRRCEVPGLHPTRWRNAFGRFTYADTRSCSTR